jgi:formate-dependent nitrite reductase membrane component NrfD
MATLPWEYMTKDTPSRDWSHGSGIFIALAFFFGGLAGGLYLISLYFDNLLGMFIAWLCALAMGLCDAAHLGNKLIVWRIALRPGSSWISRGFLFVMLFIGAAAIQMAITQWAPGGVPETLFKVIAGIGAFGVAIYSGFVVSYVSGIKFWHSSIMPLLFLVAGLTGGMSILAAANGFTSAIAFDTMKNLVSIALVVYAIVIAGHLWISTYSNNTAKHSVKTLLAGGLSILFWVVIVLIGIVAPLIITLAAPAGSQALLVVAAVCVLAGNLSLRIAILRAGMYAPLTAM